jgi:hypothetical protein
LIVEPFSADLCVDEILLVLLDLPLDVIREVLEDIRELG